MASSSSSQSKRSSGPVLRSLSPGGRLQTHNNYSLSSSSSASSFASSTSSSFYSSPSAFFQNSHQRSASPTRVNLYSSSPPLSPSFRFSIDRSTSPNRSISVSKKNHSHPISAPKRTCMCSPTTHRGSFRCSLHKNSPVSSNPAMFTPHRLLRTSNGGEAPSSRGRAGYQSCLKPEMRFVDFSGTVSDRRGGHFCIDLDELGAESARMS
uniref:Serine-rich protein-like protein n=1 Tax=Salix viminalis TaxID=40686 RepID=A0A6N2N874_SALVM